MLKLTTVAIFALATCLPIAASADEAGFLGSLHGNWAGKGIVLTRIGAKPINVSCTLTSDGAGNALSIKGNCRGLLVVNRAISANLTATGTRYSGVYVGPSGGRSALSGSRRGDAINLTVRWSKEVNGDFSANMVIRKKGDSGLILTTVDRDLDTGKTVITSDIALQRR